MAVAFKGIGTQAIVNDNGGTAKPTSFSSNVEGDFLLACCASSNASTNPSINWNDETGWTRMAANTWLSATAGQTTFYYRFAPAGGISSQTFDTASTTGSVTVGLVFTGVDESTPIDVGPNYNNHTSGTTTSVTSPAYITATDGAMGIISMNRDAAPVTITFPTSPGTYVDRIQSGSNLPGDGVINCIGTLIHASAGTQTPGAFTWTGAQEACAMSFALRPAPEGGNFDQDSFRGKDDGTETTENWITTVNTNWNQFMDANFRIRFLIEELDDVEDLNVEFQLQYRVNAGGWNDVNGSSSNARSSAGSVTDGETTTEQLDGPGTFIGSNNGVDEVNGLAGGAGMDFTTTANQEVEVEYTLQLRSADLTKGDTVDFRLLKEPDITLGSYTNTPTITPIFSNLDQTAFRGKGDGTEATENWKAAVNTNWTQAMDDNFRLRFLLSETNTWAESNFAAQLQYNLNAAGWNNVNASSSVARSFAGSVTDGEDCTEQLDGSRTFISNNDGVDEVDGLSGGANLDFTGNDEAEVEYTLQLRSADLSEGDTVQFRIAGMDSYAQTPTITPLFPTHFIMVTSTNFEQGARTTQQLTAQSGSFVSGRMAETTGLTNSPVTLSSDAYTEYEFCIEATTTATAGAQYEFRLVDEDQSGEKLETYTVTPKVTVAP